MINIEGITPKFSSIFPIISHSFINIYEYYDKIISILDHLVNMLNMSQHLSKTKFGLCLSICLKSCLLL